MSSATVRTLASGFLNSKDRFPDRTALEVDGGSLSYRQLYQRAAKLASALIEVDPDNDPPLTAICAHRSATAFAGILAALLRGHGYVPLNPSFAIHRTRTMLERAGCRALILDSSMEGQIDLLVEGITRPLVLVLPEHDSTEEIVRRWPQHTVLGSTDLVEVEEFKPVKVDPASIAYLLFTSGSTGTPKGVMVSHQNATSFIDVMIERYRITETDRMSQMFDLVFDLSVFDMFVTWERGACLCCPSTSQVLPPTAYVLESEITSWFSVPSSAVLMKRLGVLEPAIFKNLRLSLFCGEALPGEVVDAWSRAAPKSVIENLYGPTEVTVACTYYRWNPQQTCEAQCENGIVAIGKAFPRMSALVVDEEFREVAPGETGELLMSGPQVVPGYWRDPERTASAFITPPGLGAIHYRTGDRVRRPLGDGQLTYLGRIDLQIKIHGNRVELGEIEAVLRKLSGVDAVVAIGWPSNPCGADGIVAFMAAGQVDTDAIRRQSRALLPSYMVPRQIRLIEEMPLNSNGKIDRRQLLAILESTRKTPH